jgi:hypothetical protein
VLVRAGRSVGRQQASRITSQALTVSHLSHTATSTRHHHHD